MSRITNKSYRKDNPLHVSVHDNAWILPVRRYYWQYLGGVMNVDGQMVENGCCFEHLGGLYDFDKKRASFIEDAVIYIGCLQQVWGHALTDNLKKLWYLLTPEGKSEVERGTKVVYTTIMGEPLKEFAWELIRLSGINPDSFIEITRPTRFAKVVNPKNSLVTNGEIRYWWDELVLMYKSIIGNSVSQMPIIDKLYFTRSKLGNFWREMGEKSLERVFQKMGYTIVAPETLCIQDQVFLLSHCTHFAATEGSISHNAVFCKPGTKVTILRKSSWINYYQIFLDEIAQVDVTYVDAHRSTNVNKAVPVAGPFYMYITDNLERFVGHRIFHLPYWLKPSWYLYINRNRMHKLYRLITKK